MSDRTLATPPAPALTPPARAEPVLSGPSGVAGVARSGLANLIGAGLAAVAGLGVTWLVARGLGPVAAGAFFAATSAFVLVASVARLGTSTALVYWPARLRALGRTELIGACLRTGLIPVAVLGVACGIGLWFAAPYFFPRYSVPLRALSLFVPVVALAEALLATTRGYRMMRPTVLLDKISKPAGQLIGVGAVAAVAAFAGTAVSPSFWALAWVLPYLPVAVLAGLLVWRRWHNEPVGAGPDTIDGRSVRSAFWRFTGPRAVANIAQTALQRVDVLMVAALAGLAPAAAYAVAGRFVVLGQLANGSISQAVQPRLAEKLAVGDRAAAARLYQTSTAWLVIIGWPLHLSVAANADLYLGLFGASYVSAAPAVQVLAAAMLVSSGCGMVDMVLSMAGRTTWNLMNVLIALATLIALGLVTIPRLGALGAALGLAAAVAVNNLLPLSQIAVSLRLHPFGAATRLAMALSVGCFGAVPLLWRLLDPLGVADPLGAATPLLALGTGGLLYALALWRLRDRLALEALMPSRLRAHLNRQNRRDGLPPATRNNRDR